jgi:lysophospholipase L1-like esterase
MQRIMKYYKLWLPLLSIIVFFGIAEIICRSFNLTDKSDADFKFYIHQVDNDLEENYLAEDALLMWFPRPNYHDEYININSRGFRDKEHAIKKDKNVFRILCLGDSSTFGLRVERDETYHALLESKLNKESSQKRIRFEVINAGVPGYSSCQGLTLYKLKGFKYKPDIVTFYLGGNDLGRNFYLSDKEIMQNNVPVAVKVIINNLLLKLDSYRVLRKLIMNMSTGHKNNSEENVPRVSLDDYKENILELNRLCRKNGSVLVLISPPVSKVDFFEKNLQRKKVLILWREELKNIAKEYNIPLVSIPEMTEESPSDTKPFFLDMMHPNPMGHRMIMERLNDCLITNHLLP